MPLDPTFTAQVLLLSTGALFVLGALVWPVVRLWLRTGVFAITSLRTEDPAERIMGLVLAGVIAAYTALLGGYAALGPAAVDADVPGWPAIGVGAGAMLGGLALVVIAQAQMGQSWRIGIDTEPTPLITTGLYRWLRSPIYAGILLALAGVTGIIATLPAIIGWPVVAALCSWQAGREETHMASLYPKEYPAWARRTGRFFPKFW